MRTPSSCAPFPIGLATLDPPARASKGSCQPAILRAQNRRCHALATGSVYTPPPAQETELFLCVRSLRSHVAAPGYAAASSHKTSSVPCAPSARVRLSALRLINPHCARPQSWGPARWLPAPRRRGRQVGPATARAARHVAGPSRSASQASARQARIRGVDLSTKTLRGGCFCFRKKPRNPPRSDSSSFFELRRGKPPAHRATAKPSRGVRTTKENADIFSFCRRQEVGGKKSALRRGAFKVANCELESLAVARAW